jgi:hypothetical protein
MVVVGVAEHFAPTGDHLVAELVGVELEVKAQPLMEQPIPVVVEVEADTVMATDL